MQDEHAAPAFERRWTPEARTDYLVAVERLRSALAEHAAAVRGMSGANTETVELFLHNRELERAGAAFDEALFDLTGTALGWEDTTEDEFEDEYLDFDDDEDGEGEESDRAAPTVIAVLRRDDYVVTDPDAVIEAGRAAYRRVWPVEMTDDAESRVDRLGPALYELMHAAGEEDPRRVFDRTPGLRPGWSVTAFAEAGTAMQGEVAEPFTDDDLTEVYRLTESPRRPDA